jgi:hypothetical protein
MTVYYILCTALNEIKNYVNKEGKSIEIPWKKLPAPSIAGAIVDISEYETLKNIPLFKQEVDNHIIAVLKFPNLPTSENKIEVAHSFEFYKEFDRCYEEQLKYVKEEKLSHTDLEKELAKTILYLQIQGEKYNDLYSHYVTLAFSYIENDPSISYEERVKRTNQITEQNRLDVGKIQAEGRKITAWKGAIAKSKGKKAKEQEIAKEHVKEKWDEWQKQPEKYENNSAFAKSMCDELNQKSWEEIRSEEEVISPGVIQNWCTKWMPKKIQLAK